MSKKPKFEVRQAVYKHTGNYGGPGIVRGIASDDGLLRYLVGHKIESGYGEFYHVYAEGNLREYNGLADLPTITKEEGLRSRTGLPTPDEPTANEVRGILAPTDVLTPEQVADLKTAWNQPTNARLLPGTAPDTELLDALVTAHQQVDMLLAMVVTLDKTFMPSQSPLWPGIVERAELLRKHGATL